MSSSLSTGNKSIIVATPFGNCITGDKPDTGDPVLLLANETVPEYI